jgi:prepilin-type N-terminal cleavage/methylation domain-containing protein
MPSRSLSVARCAFTLLELVAVVVLLGIITVIGLVVFRGYSDQLSLVHATQTLMKADERERQASRLSPVAGGLEVDRARGRLKLRNTQTRIDLDRNVSITHFYVSRVAPSIDSVLYTQSGQSHSFAMRLRTRRGAERWVIVLGMTGQILVLDDATEARRWMDLADLRI